MSLKQLNVGSHPSPTPKGWTPDKRLIQYEYEAMTVPTTRLPQGTLSKAGAPPKPLGQALAEANKSKTDQSA